MQKSDLPTPLRRDAQLVYEASKKSQAEAKAKTAMLDELRRVMQTTRNEYIGEVTA